MKPIHIVLGLILGWAPPALADNDYERGDEKNEHRDCYQSRGHCEDNDSVNVIICPEGCADDAIPLTGR